MIESFFRPFLGGVFLERELSTSSAKLEFLFDMFAKGDAALPSQGMQAIPRQIARQLPAGSIRTHCPVDSVEAKKVAMARGDKLQPQAVVVATEAPAAAKLLGEACDIKSLGVFCLYFAAPRPPLEEPILILNGEGQGPINNLCVPSQVAANYAPQGQALVSITVLDDGRFAPPDLFSQVQAQLVDWFGEQVLQWNHLRTHRIDHALPDQTTLEPIVKPVRRSDGVFLCGDYLEIASIEGAMSSGRRAAEAVIQAVRMS